MEGAGWLSFAGIMLVMVGFFNVIDGISAIGNSDYVVNKLLFANLDAWGWFFLIWGVLRFSQASHSRRRGSGRSSHYRGLFQRDPQLCT
jgi:hypothetical protein